MKLSGGQQIVLLAFLREDEVYEGYGCYVSPQEYLGTPLSILEEAANGAEIDALLWEKIDDALTQWEAGELAEEEIDLDDDEEDDEEEAEEE